MAITLRKDKESALTHDELDGNFEHLRDEKADTGHEHTESDITDLDKYTQDEVDAIADGKSDTDHTHTESDITDLDKYTQDEVDAIADGKSDTDHTHTESEITDLDKYTQDEVDSLVDGKLSDAPEDGKVYARQDGAWVEVDAAGFTSPTVSTGDAFEVASTNFKVPVTVDAFGSIDSENMRVAVEYRESSASSWSRTSGTDISEIGTYDVIVDGLSMETTYDYVGVAYDVNNPSSHVGYGEEKEATTPICDAHDGTLGEGPGPDCGYIQYDSNTDTGYYGYVGCGNEPTYASDNSYDKGVIVNDGNDEFYYSKTDSNSGNDLPSVGEENDNWKWIGSGILTDGPTVSSEIGLSAGTAFNDDCGWLKFFIGKDAADPMSTRHGTVTAKDRVVFISRKTIRYALSWNDIYNVGAVYGTGDAGTANSGSDTTQDAQITVDGNDYIVRCMTGCKDDPSPHAYEETSCDDDAGDGSEWNDLLYRVHTDEPNCSDTSVGMPGGDEDSRHGGPQDGDNWANFSNTDLQVYKDEAGDGTNSWCQEQGDNTSGRLRRGSDGVARFLAYTSDDVSPGNAFRPVLELVQS